MLVVDASVALPATLHPDGFKRLGDDTLLAPPLMWSEARSTLHEALWRKELEVDEARAALLHLEAAPVSPSRPAELGEEAWRVADEFGWAKTYDAEYVALAKLRGCRLVTADARLRRATERLGFVVALTEL
jgi:predicted nucleic acid-binding protein